MCAVYFKPKLTARVVNVFEYVKSIKRYYFFILLEVQFTLENSTLLFFTSVGSNKENHPCILFVV